LKIPKWSHFQFLSDSNGGVMVSVPASSSVDCRFEHGRVKPKTRKWVSVPSPLSQQHEGIRTGLARNQTNKSVWSRMSTCGLLFQWAL